MNDLKRAIFELVATNNPMTVRQVFYRGVSFGLWDKTEAAYKNVVGRLLVDLRRSGVMPYHWIADGTRWQRKPTTFSSMEDALQRTASTYRRALWDTAPTVLEVWLEKEALAGVILAETSKWDVPLMVTRGYASITYLHSAAEEIRHRHVHRGQATTVLYLGDRDPSGDDIAAKVETELAEMSGVPVGFRRLAVTEHQVRTLDLPTRPTKRTDSRAARWDGEGSVEVDAIDPQTLRMMVDQAIAAYVDHDQLDVLKAAEESERQVLARMAGGAP